MIRIWQRPALRHRHNLLLVDNQPCCDTIASLNHVTLVSLPVK